MSRNILQGLVGAWCPTLGPSGYTLLDRSGRGNHGTLQNMDAGTDWVGDGSGWALDFANQTNDAVTYTIPGVSMDAGTVSIWAKKQEAIAGATDYILWSVVTSATNRLYLEVVISPAAFGTSNPVWHANFGNIASGFCFFEGVTTNIWYHVVCTWAVGRPMEIYVNGRRGTPTTANYTAQSATTERIGNYSTASISFGGLVDDFGRWSRALTAPEIVAIYNMGRGGLGRLLTPQRRSYAFRVPAAAVKSYLFVNRGQVIGGGTL
jgi:hypothetical protein